MKLAIITTHPIQYYAPVFRLLHERKDITIMVFYTWGENSKTKYDPGFGSTIRWDIPLLEGYPYTWLKNTSSNPGTHHFRGVINPDLTDQVERWAPEAILVYGWAWHSHLKCIMHFKKRLPVYFRGDSTLLDETGGFKGMIKSLFLRRVYSGINCAFYTGSNNQVYFKKYGLTEKQLIFAPHAVDNDRFSEDRKKEAHALRRQLNANDGDILILFAGKFENKKSPLELLRAFLLLNKPGIHLLYAGNGALEPALKQSAEGSKNIHFFEFQNQSKMPAVLQCCDLFCLPSKGPGETWGLVVNEAMAAGKAILVSDKTGCAIDLVEPGVNGDIFRAGNVDDLSRKLALLTSNKDILSSYGRKSKERIAAWSFDKQVLAIMERTVHTKDAK